MGVIIKRSQFESMTRVSEPKRLHETAIRGGTPVLVETFWDPNTHIAYQVQVANQGEMYRATKPINGLDAVQNYGEWMRLEE